MNLYNSYKPLRNYFRKLNLSDSLIDIWHLSRHVNDNTTLILQGRAQDLRKYIYPWDLLILTREVLLNASSKGQFRLNSVQSIGKAINSIKDLENELAGVRLELDDVIDEIHRSIHRQFPFQSRSNVYSLFRYIMVFGEVKVQEILKAQIGLGIRQVLFMGFAVGGHLIKSPAVNALQDYSFMQIDRPQSKLFFDKFSITVDEYQQTTLKHHSYDENWIYTWNPIESKPFISFSAEYPDRLICPIPELLMKRISQGLFYDLVNNHGFDNAFGGSFQAYVGMVSKELLPLQNYSISEISPYEVNKNIHHGVDWIVTDATANLFVECKTKRLRRDAKVNPAGPTLRQEIDTLATAVIQTYRNIIEAEAGLSDWIPNERPSIPLVVTLEDWYFFGTNIQSMLRSAVEEKMEQSGLDISIQEHPYIIASCNEYEQLMAALNRTSILDFSMAKVDEKYAGWMLATIISDLYPNLKNDKLRQLFKNEWSRIFPDLEFPIH